MTSEVSGERYSLKDAEDIFGDFDAQFKDVASQRPPTSRPLRRSSARAPASGVAPRQLTLSTGARLATELDWLGDDATVEHLTEFLAHSQQVGELLEAWDLVQGHLEQAGRYDDCRRVAGALRAVGVDVTDG